MLLILSFTIDYPIWNNCILCLDIVVGMDLDCWSCSQWEAKSVEVKYLRGIKETPKKKERKIEKERGKKEQSWEDKKSQINL